MSHRKPKSRPLSLPISRRTATVCTGGGLVATALAGYAAFSGCPSPNPARPGPGDDGRAGPPAASRAEAVPVPGQAWMPDATRKPLDTNFTPGGMTEMRGLVLHVQEGENSLHERFNDPSVKSSSHFWVSRSGALEQYVSAYDRAWAQVAGNPSWLSVETSGFARRPLTGQQVEAVALIYAWGMAQHGWPLALASTPLDRGFGIHSMGGEAWGAHACPGPLRAAQTGEILTVVRRLLTR